MPPCHNNHDYAQPGQQDSVGQDCFFVSAETVSPVGRKKCQQCDSNDEMRPGWRARTDARHEQQLSGAGKTGKHPEQKTGTCCPKRSAGPKGVSGPPVDEVGTEYAECQGHRKSNTHRMNGMAENGNARFRQMMTRELTNRINQIFCSVLALLIGQMRLLRLSLAAILVAIVTGCQGRLSTLDPAGPAAETIALLWNVMFVGSAGIFILVTILLAMSFRAKRSNCSETTLERTWIIGLGICFTMTVLAILLAYGIVAGNRLTASHSEDAVKVSARADRSGWTFSYDARPGHSTRDILHIPAGQNVTVSITTGDVIHSFWVPRLAGKLDAIPGHVNTLKLRANEPGTYAGRSAEYSGPGYLGNRFEVRSHGADTWQAFLQGELD